MGTGTVPKPLSPTLGTPRDGGCLLPAASLSGFVPTGLCSHPPNIHVGPFPPRGAANPPRNGPGIVDRAAISLEQASLGLAAAAGLRVTLSLPQPPRQSPCPPSVLGPPAMREGSQQDAKEVVIWGTPAVKTDRFSVALPAPEMPDLLGLARVGSAWGVGPGACQPAGRSPGSRILALASLAAWLVPFLLPPVMAGAQLFTAMAQSEEQLSRSRIVGHWNYIN